MYDYLIVGSGLFGSVFANKMSEQGAKCLVLDKRNHIGGNCYTKKNENIDVHVYGPHIFHTNSERIWNYINKFSTFNNFIYRPKVNYCDKLYSFPINLFTLYQLWGVKTPSEAEDKLKQVRIEIENPKNLEEWILSQVGEELYKTFIYGYTKKQWNKDPKQLPASIIKRLPIRQTFDDNYFNAKYQGIPVDGYTKIFENLLKNVDIELNVDYLKDLDYLNKKANKIVYTGALDELFDYNYGQLEWRSLNFKEEIISIPDFQGNAVINYTSENIKHTRITEHKHFTFVKSDITVITKEYPQDWDKTKEKYYAINTEENIKLNNRYKEQLDPRYIIGGRLADYCYYDMDQVIGSALSKAEKEIYE